MKENFGLSDASIKKLLSVFEKKTSIQKAIIYGSRAIGNFREGSDIDMTLFGESLVEKDLFVLLDEIDDLLLPYTLDLSIYHLLKNEDLKDHINRVGKIFYERMN